MKKIYFVVIMLLVCVMVSGCGNSEAKSACETAVKKIYSSANDDTITSCVAEYIEDKKIVIRAYCINTEKKLYLGTNESYSVGEQYYDTWYSVYQQVLDQVSNPKDGYISYEFSANDLK